MSALRAFAVAVPVFHPADTINAVADRFLQPELSNSLSVAVVSEAGARSA